MNAQDQPRHTRLLIVDDDEKFVRLLHDYLEPFGYQVDTAFDGRDGLAKAIDGNYAAIILDVTLPGASSRQILEEARRIRPDLRVVVTSAYSKETVDASFAGLPLLQFVRKPFMVSEIVRLLKEPPS